MSDNFSLDPESNFAPIDTEHSLAKLSITGELPRGLNGTLYRNGPNPQFPPLDPRQHHWFTGDGMVHAFSLRDGTASYCNRWVRTAKWQAEHQAGRALLSGFARPSNLGIADTGVANTNIVWHAGRLLALEEAHRPWELDPATLATRGVHDFGGAVETPFTAHPKLDPVTGELVFFGYGASGPLTPGMVVGTIGSDGKVRRFERFEAPYSSMVHDFAVTQDHVLFPIMPLSGSLKRARAGQMPFAWEPELGSFVGVMRREDGVASLRWFPIENCYVFHVLNAWDEGDRIVVDVIQYDEAPLFPRADGAAPRPEAALSRLVRWTLHAQTGSFKRTELDGMKCEFPRLDERYAGLRNRYGLFVGAAQVDGGFDTVVWHDFDAERRSAFTAPAGDALSEAVFVPRDAEAPEGDGWLLVVAWRGRERRSDLIVLDTDAIEAGPIASVHLPHRVPFGFHGNWVAAAA